MAFNRSYAHGPILHRALIAVFLLSSSARAVAHTDGSEQRQQFALQKEALKAVLEAADRICATPPLDQTRQKVKLTGNAKATLSRMLSKVAFRTCLLIQMTAIPFANPRDSAA